MALVTRPVEIPVPCPSPARVGSTGTIQYLIQKERPAMDQQSYSSHRGFAGAAPSRASREFVHVCREVVSVSCGQPLLSYKPKRSKPAAKVVKPSESKHVVSRSSVDSSGRSASSRVVANAVRLAGAPDFIPVVESRRVDSPSKETTTSSRRFVELHACRKPFSHGEVSEAEEGRKSVSLTPSEHEESTHRCDYPVYQTSSGLNPSKPLPDDYHKALIPFLRAEWEASAKILKRRQSHQVSKKGLHRRSVSLGSSSMTTTPVSEEKAWQSYSRDSYPPFSASKKHSYIKLTSAGETL